VAERDVAAILKSGDLARTIDWYESAGFELLGTFPDDQPTWAALGRDGLVLHFVAGATPWEGPPTFTGCFYVHPESVQAVYDQVKDKIVCEFGVEEREWGARELTVSDPDGYFVTFTEPL
jgi:catechol 2,3-dioxygenase-like lactoylglutathione lyase family enzyme